MRVRWLAVGLVASVALNLFLIGAGVGVVALGLRIARQADRPMALFWAVQGLPPPARNGLRQTLRQTRAEIRPLAQQSLELRREAWSDLAAAQPNLARIEQQLAQSRQIDVAVRTKVEERLASYVATLGPPDRKVFAAAMRRMLTPHTARVRQR